MPILVSNTLITDFVNCRTKAHLKSKGGTGERSDFERLEAALSDEYCKRAEDHLMRLHSDTTVCNNPHSLPAALAKGFSLITNANTFLTGTAVHFDALVRTSPPVALPPFDYVPYLFLRHEKIPAPAHPLIGFCGAALKSLLGRPVRSGIIIHGPDLKASRVGLEKLIPKVINMVGTIADLGNREEPPVLRLNVHCSVCEFRNHCHALAVKADDLSLLRACKEKDVETLKKKGIFTVTQLSYTFRPRRRRKLVASTKPPKFHLPLQALAIRTNTIHIAKKPSLPDTPTRIYLDIEGIPDRNFYYLIGVLICSGETRHFQSLWANEQSDEGAAWHAFLAIVNQYSHYAIFHYGSYDSRWLTLMHKRYGGDQDLIARVQASMVNVLSLLYAQVYLPTYSNDLKSAASYFGFRWSHPSASGLQSIVWRYQWETAKSESTKNDLIRYNQDDCSALKVVTDALMQISQRGDCAIDGTSAAVVNAEEIKREHPHKIGRNPFYSPDLEFVNKCAYFDYQRERVYVRTSEGVSKSLKRKSKALQRQHKVNQKICCDRPAACPYCKQTRIHRHGPRSSFKTVYDLRLVKGGIKRWIIKYESTRYICSHCRRTFHSPAYLALDGSHFGHTLRAWCIYNNIALRQSHGQIADGLDLIFGYTFYNTLPSDFKKDAAIYYRPTFNSLMDRILNGKLIHVDETKVSLRGGIGYIWAFTNLEEVIYIFRPSREGDWLKDFLRSFCGVLVSDFYTAYDSVDCVHQRCLIHFMRDINDDLLQHPFDADLKKVGQWFTATIRPIVETIDRFGLKQRHLNKHKALAEKFVRDVLESTLTSDVAKGYQRRIRKYQGKLFTFLDYDGVPWNNNNAEHAIKRFAFLRNVIGGSSTEAGIQEYLTLLSVFETTRLRGIRFLPFLISGETDIDAFSNKRR